MSQAPRKSAVIIGAGPAGLTAAFELLDQTDVSPLVLEADQQVGGLAKTVRHRGYGLDLGGHRFFSKSDRVMRWWLDRLPLERLPDGPAAVVLGYHHQHAGLAAPGCGPDPRTDERVMLLRERRSRIYFLRRFFDYPIKLSPALLRNLGARRSLMIGLSYLKVAMLPRRRPRNLEEFLVGRFGRRLYETFFRSYTEKVWGVPCREISAEWGAQRVKGLSVARALAHFLGRAFRRADLAQKRSDTSLIERFLYPKRGPGQLWELVTEQVRHRGGRVLMRRRVERLETAGPRVCAVVARNLETGESERYPADYFVSTMAIRDLVSALDCEVPEPAREIAAGLRYRDFITIGLLVDRLRVVEAGTRDGLIRDNWIYVQEPDVRVGRLQIFNNWSPYLLADPGKVWLGLEYFCNEGDDLWAQGDQALAELGARELERIGILEAGAVRDSVVVRVPKTYPAYFGTFDRFDELRGYLDGFENLFLIGRNGMHRYNNQDHSMLCAMLAVENIKLGRRDKDNLWAVNTEEDYLEERSS